MTEEEITKLTLRMPVTLYERIGRRSMKNRRSLNNEIVIMLERLVAAEESLELSAETRQEKIG